MNAQASFASILDRAPTEIERPKPLPVGSYTTVLVGQPRYDKSTKKQTEFVEFMHKFIGFGEDVDEGDLKEVLGDRALNDMTMKNTFYLTEGSIWRLKEFLTNCGLDTEDEKTSLRELIEETPGRTVGIFINHEASQDGQSIFARIGKTFVVE